MAIWFFVLKLFRNKKVPISLAVKPTPEAERLVEDIFRAVIEALGSSVGGYSSVAFSSRISREEAPTLSR